MRLDRVKGYRRAAWLALEFSHDRIEEQVQQPRLHPHAIARALGNIGVAAQLRRGAPGRARVSVAEALPRPVLEPCQNPLQRAEVHLQQGDMMAAAVYLRAAFESRLKNVCCDCRLKIPYQPAPRRLKADELWNAIVAEQQARQANKKANFIDPQLMNDVEAVRSVVLNRLRHSGTPGLTEAEMRHALEVIRRLQHHTFR